MRGNHYLVLIVVASMSHCHLQTITMVTTTTEYFLVRENVKLHGIPIFESSNSRPMCHDDCHRVFILKININPNGSFIYFF